MVAVRHSGKGASQGKVPRLIDFLLKASFRTCAVVLLDAPVVSFAQRFYKRSRLVPRVESHALW